MKNSAAHEVFGVFDFGLSDAQEARARQLHEESIIVDMLFQGPLGYRNMTPEMDTIAQQMLESGRSGDEILLWSSVYPMRLAMRDELPDYITTWRECGVTVASRDIEIGDYASLALGGALITAEFDTYDWLVKALHVADIRRAKAEGKQAGYVNCQPVIPINLDLDMLDIAYDMGLRVLMLTYNMQTAVGAGCTERNDGGLSHFGVKVIERLNKLGIIVDTAHCGRQTTLDACALSKTPVIATHSAAEGVYQHNRGKSDEELRAIAASGGLIGVVAVPSFLGAGRDVTLETMLDHIDYIANLVGWQHVGIGTDWPLPRSKWILQNILNPMWTTHFGFHAEHALDASVNLIGFDDYRDFVNITRGLVKRGYNDIEIKGILGENFLRVFEQVCG